MIMIMFMAWCTPGVADHHVDAAKVAKVKAAFTYNFIKYTTWPKAAFAESDSPIVIGLLGRSPVDEVLEKIVAGKRLNGRPFTCVRIEPPDVEGLSEDQRRAAIDRCVAQISPCHVLYMTKTDTERTKEILTHIDRKHLLIIGDTPQWVQRGAMLAMGMEKGRIVFYANMANIQATDLKISSKLLRLARLSEE